MIALLLLILAVGAVLGLRFKMFVLAPAMLMISAVTVAFGIVNSQGVPFILLMVFTGLALLQIGYFTGCVLHGYLTFKSQEHDRRPWKRTAPLVSFSNANRKVSVVMESPLWLRVMFLKRLLRPARAVEASGGRGGKAKR
jgi:hypothetical protein